MYYALLEGRFLFDFVHEDKLGAEDLTKYSALLLPNTALLSDEQCRQLRAYVDCAAARCWRPSKPACTTSATNGAPISAWPTSSASAKPANPIGTLGNAYLARIEKQHEILNGFAGTNWIPGAENRVPVAPVDGPVLTVVPGFVAYPPELSYPLQAHTDEPAVVVREKGKSRLVYFPGDIERTMWRQRPHRSGPAAAKRHPLGRRRTAHPSPSRATASIETFAWETQAGFAVHVLNYTNPAMHRGWIRDFYPIGAQKVKMLLPQGRRVTRVELLRAEKNIPYTQSPGAIEFTIPSVLDYEAAALYSAPL